MAAHNRRITDILFNNEDYDIKRVKLWLDKNKLNNYKRIFQVESNIIVEYNYNKDWYIKQHNFAGNIAIVYKEYPLKKIKNCKKVELNNIKYYV